MSALGVLLFIALSAVTAAGLTGFLARLAVARPSLVFAATLAVLAVFPDLLGRPFHDVAVGAALTALVAAPGLYWLRLRPPPAVARPPFDPVAAAIAGALFLAMAWCALTTFLWDERSGHFGLASAVSKGGLPLIHPQFPDVPFNYHAGFDVITGLLRRLTHAPIEHCIDAVSLSIAACLLWTLHDVGYDLAGRRGARLLPALALLAYGPLSLCLDVVYGFTPSCSELFPASWHHALYVPPPVISNFFQHPQGLGIAVALAALTLGDDDARPRFFLAAALIALCAQCHVVLFGLGGLALAAIVVARTVRTKDVREGAVRGAALVAALLFALVEGGFLAHSEARAQFAFVGHFHAAFHTGALGTLAMNALLFTPALCALPWGLWRARAGGMRVGLVVAALAGFAVGNVLSYERSWDIVKFFGAGALFANLLLADALAALMTRTRAAVVVVLALLCALAGGTWLLRYGPLNGVIAPVYTERAPDPFARDVDNAFGDVVGLAPILTDRDTLQELGFAMVGFDWREASKSYLIDRDRRDALTALKKRALATLSLDDIRATGAAYVLVPSDAHVDPALTRVGDVDGYSLWRTP